VTALAWGVFWLLHPIVGWVCLWYRFNPKTYLGLVTVIIWGAVMGWLCFAVEAFRWWCELKFWHKRFRR
jgi:hypothetical protein